MTDFTRRSFLKTAAAVPLATATVVHAEAHSTIHEVAIAGMAFAPADLEVAAGDTIQWTNTDGAPHTATAENGSFDTGRLNRGDSAAIVIGTPGEYTYVCAIHPSMKAVIRVV